jgi:hypothetical protein
MTQMTGKQFSALGLDMPSILASVGEIVLTLYSRHGVRPTHVAASDDELRRQLAIAFGMDEADNAQPNGQVLVGIDYKALQIGGPAVAQLVLPNSSRLKAAQYDKLSETLTVTFQDGSRYQYFDVPVEVAYALTTARSVGAMFQTTIVQADYEYKRIEASEFVHDPDGWDEAVAGLTPPEPEPEADEIVAPTPAFAGTTAAEEPDEEPEPEADDDAVEIEVEADDWQAALRTAYAQLGRNPVLVSLPEGCPDWVAEPLRERAVGYQVIVDGSQTPATVRLS